MSNKGFFFDFEELDSLIATLGSQQWSNFSCTSLRNMGTAFRLNFEADGQQAMLNIYKKKDGTISMQATGKNLALAEQFAEIIYNATPFKNDVHGTAFPIKSSQSTLMGLVDFLLTLEGVSIIEQINGEDSARFRLTSRIGDRVTITYYGKTGTLLVQGKPLYLYSHCINYLAGSTDVSIDNIIESHIAEHKLNIDSSSIHNEISTLMPTSYFKLNPFILKLMSPSFVLKKLAVDMEDYSCYVFPVLKALEGYLKHLLDLCGIQVKDNFGGIFKNKKLMPRIETQINNDDKIQSLEFIYDYLVRSRHVFFHASQIIITTRVIEDITEAHTIINDVPMMIEKTYRYF